LSKDPGVDSQSTLLPLKNGQRVRVIARFSVPATEIRCIGQIDICMDLLWSGNSEPSLAHFKSQEQHPRGFVVRLHVLGDFYSVDYVNQWYRWLTLFPALHIFGYTSWQPSTPIGARIAMLAAHRWARFAVRTSDGPMLERATRTISDAQSPLKEDAIVCPAQTNQTECCGTCGLCWGTQRNIAFLVH
jgi:hypothetical protein